VLDSDIPAYTGTIKLDGGPTTNIILKDGYTLTVSGQILGYGNSLKIYGQGYNGGSSRLIVTASSSGTSAFQGRDIEIHGGVITMTGNGGAGNSANHGIYVADGSSLGFFKMYGGEADRCRRLRYLQWRPRRHHRL
jgi:hypothetical protein